VDKPPWSELGAHLETADKAREYLERLRWGKSGAICPHCGGTQPYRLDPENRTKTSGRKGLYKCRIKHCRKQFTVTVGTAFEYSHLPLNKKLQALYLITSSKTGISSHRLHQMLDITYRSASFMTHRLRYAITIGPLSKLIGGARRRMSRARAHAASQASLERPRTTNEKPIRIDAPFRKIVSALLQTPAPPSGTPAIRAKKAKTTIRKVRATIRKLRAEFAAAHTIGMSALTRGDYAAMDAAIKRERALIEAHARMARTTRRAGPKGKPR
jgi:transposase-like protein